MFLNQRCMSVRACHCFRWNADAPEPGDQARCDGFVRAEHAWWKERVVISGDNTVAEFLVMEYGPSAGDAPHNGDSMLLACGGIDRGFEVLKPAERNCGRIPTIEAKDGHGFLTLRPRE